MTLKLTPMEHALLDTLDQMAKAAQTRDLALTAKIDDLTQQLQQHEASVASLRNSLSPFLPKGSSTQ